MVRFPISLLAILALGVGLAGCDRSDARRAAPADRGPVRTGSGIIRGTVFLAGKPPVMATLPNQPCHAGAPHLKEETVVTDGSGHLQNVIVYLQDAPAAGGTSLPPAVLDQVDCHYVPHVLALQTGQTLHCLSSDPTLHNVHGLCAANDPFNFALISAGQSRDITFDRPDQFPITCDVHPWMKAYVQVFAHPWFAVTAKDGSFEIRNVPPGTYTLAAWHEKYGTLTAKVTASDGTVSHTSFKFESGI